MRRGTITCSTTEGPVTVPALIGSYLAVHRSLVSGKYLPLQSDDWTVTHLASGFVVEWCDTQSEGRAVIEWLEREHGADLTALSKLDFGQGPPNRGKLRSASRRLFLARQHYRESIAA